MMNELKSMPRTEEQLNQKITEPDEDVLRAIETCPGRFAVLGAGGKMGYHLCSMLHRALQDLGRHDAVIAVSRFKDPESSRRFDHSGIEVVSADLSDPDHFERLPNAANIVFLAGVKFGTSSDPDLLRQINIVMPRRIADHYRDSRIVALSTGCVYSFTSPRSGGSTEQSPTEPPGEYAQSCLGREQAFCDASHMHGTPIVLVRLNYSVELRYGVLVDIAQKVLSGLPVDVTTGYVNVIWQGDAISQIIRCLPLATSPPLVLNVTGRETLSVRDVAHRFAALFGKPAIIEGTESETAWLSNSTKATTLFGKPKVDVETMIQWIADWLSRGGKLFDKPTHFEVRDGRY